MTVSDISCGLTHLPSIGLEELTERAALQTRVDRKYVVPTSELDGLLGRLDADARVLEIDLTRVFTYESVYFDTPELTSYLLAARRRRHRFKVRTRAYVDSSLCWLEVKTRGPRGYTVKNRLPYEPDHHARIDPGRWFVDTVLADTAGGCRDLVFGATLTSRYRRRTVFLPATSSRVTIDTDLHWRDDRGHRLELPGLAIIETKTGSTPSAFDRLLWTRGHRPARISKYATALAALRPDLPATPWWRTLRRHFAPATQAHLTTV
jgi:hypothetical protein